MEKEKQNQIENERALRLRESQMKKAESGKKNTVSAGSRLGGAELGLVVFFAMLTDGLAALIAIIPYIGWIIGVIIKILAWLTVAMWVMSRGFRRPWHTLFVGGLSATWSVLIIASYNSSLLGRLGKFRRPFLLKNA